MSVSAPPSTMTAATVARKSVRDRLPLGLLSVLGVILLEELLARTEVVPSRYMPPMSATLRQLLSALRTGEFWGNVAETAQGWGIGLALAIVLAVPSGILIASSWFFDRATRVLIEFCRPIPSVALIPLSVLVFGTGTSMTVFLVTFASFWPLLIQTMYGVRDVDPVLLDTGRTFGVRPVHRLFQIKLPSAVPYIATGVRISSAFALMLSVTAELVAGSGGLGQAIVQAQVGGAVTLMYALIIATGALAWALNIALRAVERRVLRWHVSQRTSK